MMAVRFALAQQACDLAWLAAYPQRVFSDVVAWRVADAARADAASL
jgi:hypothetical protein